MCALDFHCRSTSEKKKYPSTRFPRKTTSEVLSNFPSWSWKNRSPVRWQVDRGEKEVWSKRSWMYLYVWTIKMHNAGTHTTEKTRCTFQLSDRCKSTMATDIIFLSAMLIFHIFILPARFTKHFWSLPDIFLLLEKWKSSVPIVTDYTAAECRWAGGRSLKVGRSLWSSRSKLSDGD